MDGDGRVLYGRTRLTPRLGILISGRGSNLQSIIDAVQHGRLDAEIAVVIANRREAVGFDRARNAGIEALVFINPREHDGREAYDAAVADASRARGVGLVCLAGFMRLVGTSLLDAFPNRVLNIHPSLLPSFPGLHAQKQALDHGVRVSGVKTEDVRDLAGRAIRTRREVSQTGPTSAGRQAMVAQPTFDADGKITGAAVFATSLSDVQDNVALIRRQVLLSGGIALVIAVLAGYLVARALAARVKRLERAARKVAAGDFSQPIRADSEDELGRLAAAFDDMQNQLARLDRARKQFIASASHELRTPIFSLGGFLELLADEDLDEETRRAVPRADPRPGRPDAQPRGRAARPLAAGGRRARAAAGADRRRPARARGRGGVHAGRRRGTSPT